ncbi:Lrp/AsnC family transcriptional regulator [Demequina mangrovi]|uniref:Transcriptional regulator, AsnC family n=1 Tax=Demequina mangrovi TaxID=1043493 RepID=A0A1H6YHZ4_9MICO|nr:Lrp/AsnC family transcriptional regulator [Demequina mangrovi]SEJ36842.1 transcriptional regulator, AsnC family [Demequina mangrovi]
MSLDDLDRRIIDELRLDGRASYAEMGLRIGLSPSAVKRRVDRMLADRVIQGFRVRLDPGLDAGGTEAYVEVFCRGTVAPEELRRILESIPNVVEAFTVTGQADAIVRLRAATMPDLEIALERVRLAPQVDKTRSAIVLSRLVESRVD